MKKKTSKLLALLVAGVMALSLAACGNNNGGSADTPDPSASGDPAPSGETIKVGSMFNITGGQASLDEPGARGFQLYFDELNKAGGINGRMVEVVAYDGKTDQTTCATNTSKLIDVDKVVAIAGLADSNYAFAAGNVAQQSSVPFVFSGATTPTLNDIGNYVFLTAFGDDTCAYACADYMVNEMGLTKAYMLVDQSMDFTTTLARCFQERLEANGGEVVMTDTYMCGDPDFSAQIGRFMNDSKGAEVLFFSSVPSDVGTITKQFRDKGVTLPFISGDGADTPLLMEVAGDAAEGFLISTHCSFENEDPAVQDFVTLYTETQGVAPENAFAALGYDSAHVIATAIAACGDDVTPANVRDQLEAIQNLRCVTGVISYTPENHVPQKSATINVVENGAFAFVAELNP